MGIKLLVSGLPLSGKTTVLQTLEDVLVIARDGKRYPFPQAHSNVPDFDTAEELVSHITEKINAYETKFGKLPKTIAIDSISKIFLDIEGNVLSRVKSFPYGVVNTEIKLVVDFIERDLADAFNVIMLSHAMFDEELGGFKLVNAGGSWSKKGGIVSEVDESVFIEVKGKKRIIHMRNSKMLSRTTIADLPESMPIEDFNLQEHLTMLIENQGSVEEFSL